LPEPKGLPAEESCRPTASAKTCSCPSSRPPVEWEKLRPVETIGATRIAIASSGGCGKLKQSRHITTRYDKTILSFESFLSVAAAPLWLTLTVNAA